MNELEQALRNGRRHQEEASAAADAFRARAEAEGLLDVAYTTVDSPVGRMLVARTRKITLSMGETAEESAALDGLTREECDAHTDEVLALIRE